MFERKAGMKAEILKGHDCWGVAWPLGWECFSLCKTMEGEKQLGCHSTESGLRTEIVLGCKF